MRENDDDPGERIGVVVDCILVGYPGDPEARGRIAQAVLVWAKEHPDEWDELQARCRHRHEVFV